MTEEPTLAKAARGTGVLATQGVINTLLGAAFFMFIARVLTKEEMGIYGGVSLVISIAAIIGCLGLESAVTRFISYLQGRSDIGGMKSATRRILTLSLMSSTILTLSYFIVSPVLSDLMFRTSAHADIFRIGSLVLFTIILAYIFEGLLTGLQRFSRLALLRFIAQLVKIATTVLLLLAGLGLKAVFFGLAAFYFSIITMALALTKELVSEGLDDKSNVFPMKSLLFFSLPMMVYSVAQFASSSVDSFIILALLNAESLGSFTIAMMGSTFAVSIFAMPMSTTLMPSMSKIHGRSSINEVSNALTLASRYIALFFVPVTFGLATLSPIAIRILAGSKYVDATLPFAIASLGISTYGFSLAIISSLTAIGKTTKVMQAFLMSFAFGLAICFTLTSILKIPGAALGRAIMYMLTLLVLLRIGSTSIPISFDKKALFGGFGASTIMALCLYPIALLTGFSPILLPLYLFLGVVVYALTLLIMSIPKKTDARFLCEILPYSVISRLETILRKPLISRIVNKISSS